MDQESPHGNMFENPADATGNDDEDNTDRMYDLGRGSQPPNANTDSYQNNTLPPAGEDQERAPEDGEGEEQYPDDEDEDQQHYTH